MYFVVQILYLKIGFSEKHIFQHINNLKITWIPKFTMFCVSFFNGKDVAKVYVRI
jgi:hypothetical protein